MTAIDELNASFKQEGFPELITRIGVHHGSAIVGNFGNKLRSDYTAIGPTVNKASRIEALCEPGKVYISKEVKELLPEGNAVKAGVFELRGISPEEPLYVLVGSGKIKKAA